MPEPKLTSFLDVDFAKLRDTQGNRMTKSWQGFPGKGVGTLLIIDLAPGCEWPHSCFWIAMTHVTPKGESTTGFRPWCWAPALGPQPAPPPEDEVDQELYDYLDTLDPDGGAPYIPPAWDKSKPRPKKDPVLEDCPVLGKCSVCKETQYDTPSGSQCKNGHGGEPTL